MTADRQPRLISLVESLCNVGTGFLLSMILWQFVVAPAFGYAVTIQTNFAITSIFTLASIARSYLWRRFFANGLHSALVRAVTGRTKCHTH